MDAPSNMTTRTGRTASRLLRLWLLFQIPTLLLVLFGLSVSPSGGLGWPIGLGLPALLILSVCALLTWALEGRKRPSESTAPPARAKAPRGLIWAYVVLPFVLAHLVLVPLALFAANFSLSNSPAGPVGGLVGYAVGLGVYVALVGLPLAAIWRLRRRSHPPS